MKLIKGLIIAGLLGLGLNAEAQGVVCPAGVMGCGGGGSATASNISDAISCTDAGGDDTYVCDPTTPVTNLTNLVIAMKVSTGNTGAATVNVSGLGVKDIKVAGASIADPATNDIRANSIVLLKYDGTQFLILSRSGITGAGTGDMIAANNLSDVANASTARTNLGLAIGTNVQAYDGELAAVAGLTSAADKLPYWTGAGTAANADFTAFGRSIVDDANAAAGRTTLGVVIGTDVQAQNANLAALAGLTFAADKCNYWSGATTAVTMNCTSAGRSMIGAADATAQTALLNAMVGDSGSGGTKGLVPAPSAGDAAAGKYLKADGTWATVSGGSGKTDLVANTTFYVRTDGSNSNNGLANTAGGAWLTPQYGYDYIVEHYNLNGHWARLQIADGTYGDLTISQVPSDDDYYWTGAYIGIRGNTLNPENVVIGTVACVVNCYLEYLTFSSADVSWNSNAFMTTVRTSGYIGAYDSADLKLVTPTFTASATNAIVAQGNSYVDVRGTVTFSGSPAYSNSVLIAIEKGKIYWRPSSVTGTHTGTSVILATGGAIEATVALPGNSLGINDGSGKYNGKGIPITSATTFYVRTDGSDSNTGLANTAGGACLTIQGCYDKIINGYNVQSSVTLQIANGTYTGDVILHRKYDQDYYWNGTMIFVTGDTTTPSNVVISGNVICDAQECYVRGVKADTLQSNGAYASFVNNHVKTIYSSGSGATVVTSGANNKFFGSVSSHAYAQYGKIYIGGSWNFDTTTVSDSTYYAGYGGVVIEEATITGSTTGPKYKVEAGGEIYVAHAIPGTTAGVVNSGSLRGGDIVSGIVPTVSSCGTSPSAVVGDDRAGRLTVGTGTVTSCTVTFAAPSTTAPVCYVNNETTAQVMQAVPSSTALVINGADFNGDVISYICKQ